MAFLSDKDIVELYAFAKETKPPDQLVARIREYIDMMIVVTNNMSHPAIKDLENRLEEVNKRAHKNRPHGSKIPISYLLTIQHLPLMRKYTEGIKA